MSTQPVKRDRSGETSPTSIIFPPPLKARIRRAVGRAQTETGEDVGFGEWVRQACEEKLEREEQGR